MISAHFKTTIRLYIPQGKYPAMKTTAKPPPPPPPPQLNSVLSNHSAGDGTGMVTVRQLREYYRIKHVSAYVG